tara:strand:+ start:116 stop:469 length:354 start_codon:yes stop_codon:yes gene_type:complete
MELIKNTRSQRSVLQTLINIHTNEISEKMERLINDFDNEFTWVAQDLIVHNLKLKSYKLALHIGIDKQIEILERFTSNSFNVIGTSTCSFSNLKLSIQFKASMELIDKLKSISLSLG